MFTELHFKHNTVCQFTTDEELLESPFENNGDTNVLTFPQGKCNSQIRNVFIAMIRFFFFFFLFPTLNFKQSEIWLNLGYSNPCPSNCQAVITI